MPAILRHFILLAAGSGPVMAEINIELRATVVNLGCAVESADSNQTVDLGRWLTSHLQTAGSTTPPVPFSIRLKGCPPGSVSVTFLGKAASGTMYLALNDSVMAQKLAIELRDGNRQPLALDTASQPVKIDSHGDSILQFYANYIALEDNPPAGAAKSDATFMINYY